MHTFVAIVDAGRFQDAAAGLDVTQQAVSKRITALERSLGVRLFTRTARGARLTLDGEAFLPHARELVRVAERAAAAVRPGRRALRVDVVGRRFGPAGLLRAFHRAHPDTELDVVTLADGAAAVDALRAGTLDAAVRAVTDLPDDLAAVRVFDEPVQLLTGPAHPLAAARAVAPADLAGHPIWMPGNVAGTEWTAYYDAFAAAFGFTIDVVGPSYGTEPLLDVVAGSPTLATLVGEQTRLLWPADYDLRRVPLRPPVPVYPHCLVWHRGNGHPALAALRDHLQAVNLDLVAGKWVPGDMAVTP